MFLTGVGSLFFSFFQIQDFGFFFHNKKVEGNSKPQQIDQMLFSTFKSLSTKPYSELTSKVWCRRLMDVCCSFRWFAFCRYFTFIALTSRTSSRPGTPFPDVLFFTTASVSLPINGELLPYVVQNARHSSCGGRWVNEWRIDQLEGLSALGRVEYTLSGSDQWSNTRGALTHGGLCSLSLIPICLMYHTSSTFLRVPSSCAC